MATRTANRQVEELTRLAHDKSEQGRSRLLGVINEMFTDSSLMLSGGDRQLMLDIMHQLVGQVEISVRRALAENLAQLTDVPRDLIWALANDEIEVAYPILINSEILKDPDLIEIVQNKAMAHQVAVAMRPSVTPPVTDVLVETGNEQVISAALKNAGASFSPETMGRLAEQSERNEHYQTLLANRDDLPPPVVKKLYWMVSAALRVHIVRTYDIDETTLDQMLEATVKRALGESPSEQGASQRPSDKADQGFMARWENDLLLLIDRGQILEFISKLADVSGLRLPLLQRLLFEEGGEGLAILCTALGISKSGFAKIFIRFRQGRLGDKQVPPNEVMTAVSFYDQSDPTSAQALVSRWRRDPDYLNALRQIETS